MSLFRIMLEKDLDQVVKMENEIFSIPWSRDDFIKAMQDMNNGYFVMEELDDIIAYCGYWGIVGEGNIYNVAVKKEYRGKTLGYQMLSQMIKVGFGRGITSYTLEVRYSNEPAIKLYERLGFESAGVRKSFYSNPTEDAVIMWLKPIQ